MSEELNEQTDSPQTAEQEIDATAATVEEDVVESAQPAEELSCELQPPLPQDDPDDDDAPLIPQSEEEVHQAALDEMASTVEAILFSSGGPIPPAKLSAVTELPVSSVKKALRALNGRYEQGGCSFRVVNIAGGYQLMTLPEYNDVLKKLLNVHKESRLSQAAMETLAIVAYRQPILRADIESIRGVACGEVLRSLMERQLIKIVGRAEVIGRPMLYGTSKKFLEIFGLGSLEDLPRAEELRQPADKSISKKQEKPEEAQEEQPIDEETGMKKKFNNEDDEEIRDDEFENEEEEFEDEDDEELEDDDDFDEDDDDDDDEEDEDEEEEEDEDFDDEDEFEDDDDFDDDDEDDDDDDEDEEEEEDEEEDEDDDEETF